MPRKYTKYVLSKKEMDSNTTYILCPDRSCKLFYSPEYPFPCEYNCPKKNKLEKIIKCRNCGEPIHLCGDHHMLCRVDHACPDGRHASNFQRMSGRYRLVYGVKVSSSQSSKEN